MFDFIDYKTFWVIVHLFGVIIGAGGAFASDFMFFSSIKDKMISHTEMRFLRLGSKMVWIGLAIIVVSGVFLFMSDVPRYMASSKFLVKMTIVGVIIVNGIIFHFRHIPRLHRHVGQDYSLSKEFVKKSPYLLASGVISGVSWLSAFILGALHKVPYSYWQILSFYLVILCLGILVAVLSKNRLLRMSKKD
ncbi:MAG: hypothetical protein WD898_00850 [Candidatus Paceibacterota bacterium]